VSIEGVLIVADQAHPGCVNGVTAPEVAPAVAMAPEALSENVQLPVGVPIVHPSSWRMARRIGPGSV
jgi:hypothetical protein